MLYFTFKSWFYFFLILEVPSKAPDAAATSRSAHAHKVYGEPVVPYLNINSLFFLIFIFSGFPLGSVLNRNKLLQFLQI